MVIDPKLTTEEAAEYIGAKAQTLANWRVNRRQTIPFLKIGTMVRYRKSDLDAYLESCVVGAEPALAN